jgi:hypothetical protein
MIKDPLNQQETPYDILEIDFNTPMLDLHQALPRFMRKNKAASKIAVAQEAIRKLKNIQERLAFDITYYSLVVMEGSSVESLCDIQNFASQLIMVPVSEPADYLTDLDSGFPENAIPSYPFRSNLISDIPEFSRLNQTELYLPLDNPDFGAVS